jgi:hypothetical protein
MGKDDLAVVDNSGEQGRQSARGHVRDAEVIGGSNAQPDR